MKKYICLILILALALSGCGQKGEEAAKTVDLQPVYDSLLEKMPEMLLLDESLRLNLLGISGDDCQQVITAICADSMRVDEIWLLQAKDEAALERLAALAQTRVDAQAEVCESYSPEQYAVVKKAELVKQGLYLALLIGPEASEMKKTVTAALG